MFVLLLRVAPTVSAAILMDKPCALVFLALLVRLQRVDPNVLLIRTAPKISLAAIKNVLTLALAHADWELNVKL